jgi:hypothetical protein
MAEQLGVAAGVKVIGEVGIIICSIPVEVLVQAPALLALCKSS